MSKVKSPVGIFVLWHPSFEDGQKYANLIFSEFKRNVNSPLSRGLNIPVFFRYMSPLLPIPFSDYDHVVVVAIVDPCFVLDDDYNVYLKELAAKGEELLLIPVAIDPSAFIAGLGNINFARLYERKDHKMDYLVSIVAHEMVRRHVRRLKEENADNPPLKLFISHAKADGVRFAEQLKAFVEKQLPLKTFFDTNDIAVSQDFSNEIEHYIERAVIIAIQTDLYSTREWCRREVLLSKQHNRPIVILNCFQKGESRSFPYMANVLTMHYDGLNAGKDDNDAVWSHLITAVLKETLRLGYLEMYLPYIAKLRGRELNEESVSAYPPELITVLKRRARLKGEFIYPDPPLGSEELAILNEFIPEIKFMTPIDL